MVGLTLVEWDLLLLQKVRSGSTCSDPPPSWVMCVVNGKKGNMERIIENPLHILGVMHHGLII